MKILESLLISIWIFFLMIVEISFDWPRVNLIGNFFYDKKSFEILLSKNSQMRETHDPFF